MDFKSIALTTRPRQPSTHQLVKIGRMQEYVNDDTSTLIDQKNLSLPTGFEPVRAEPNGFRVHRLNHSATTAYVPTRECRTAKIKYLKNPQDQFESTKTDAFFLHFHHHL